MKGASDQEVQRSSGLALYTDFMMQRADIGISINVRAVYLVRFVLGTRRPVSTVGQRKKQGQQGR